MSSSVSWEETVAVWTGGRVGACSAGGPSCWAASLGTWLGVKVFLVGRNYMVETRANIGEDGDPRKVPYMVVNFTNVVL